MKVKRFLSVLFCGALALTLLPMSALAASDPANFIFDVSEGNITISNAGGGNLTVAYGAAQTASFPGTQAITITGTTANNTVTVNSGVAADITLSSADIQPASGCALNINGTANINLTLAGNNVLKSGGSFAGLRVPDGATLTIGGTGSLAATGGNTGSSDGAGIGSGYSENSGNITISGGTVIATGGYAGAGIGGGTSGNSGKVIISGGTVTANGGHMAAGIGGGCNGNNGDIVISGGTVTANGGDIGGIGGGGAGIGGGGSPVGGMGGSGGTIEISGGTVTANGASSSFGGGGAGIGGGGCDASGVNGGVGGTVRISGGSVNAVGSMSAADIGPGQGGSGGTLKNGAGADVFLTTVTLSGAADETAVSQLTTDAGYAYGPKDVKTNGADVYVYLPADKHITGAKTGVPTPTAAYLGAITTAGAPSSGTLYPAAFDVTGDPTGYMYDYTGSHTLTINQGGSYTVSMLVPGSSTTTDSIIVSGGSAADPVNLTLNGVDIRPATGCAFDIAGATVNLTLVGDNTLVSGIDNAGLQIPEGAALTIGGTGLLTANGGENGAGIGGGNGERGGVIHINNGTVTATGGTGGAGTGGGKNGRGGSVIIEGGAVTARGGTGGAGIGGGTLGGGGTIQINDGSVEAMGGNTGAGIGGGEYRPSGNITINGGTVKAYSESGAGIGGGNTGNGGNIAITGGTVTASSNSGAGIGGGVSGDGGAVTISGGIVKAAETGGGQDIGYGQGGSGGTLDISGGAAVFLRNDNCTTPTTTTHTHFTDNKSYGVLIPAGWTAFGSYLRIYTLSYNANNGGGTVPAGATQLYQTTAAAADGSGLTRTGYGFGGWNTKADGSGTGYAAGDTFTFTADSTLYAKWAANTYTVEYNANGGTGATASSSHVYDAAKTLTANGFTRTGYTFTGWAENAGGAAIYTDRQSVKNLASSNSAKVTLYAKWTAVPQLASSVSGGSVFTGGRITLTPNIPGGTWSFDVSMLSRDGNTFTALKTGTVRVTYTVEGQSTYYDITAKAAQLPKTGQDGTWIYVLAGLAAAAVVAAVSAGKYKYRAEK